MKRLALWAMAACSAWATAQSMDPGPYTGTASGVVFEDLNRNGRRDRREPGVPNVLVSNQRDFARTDRQGRWKLGHNDDTLFYVVKPRNWMTPVDNRNVPQFSYSHKPKGSPQLRFAGVAPTGSLPASIDFPLYRHREPDSFTALFFGDTQPRDLREVDYLMRDVFEPLIGRSGEHAFGVTLGDVVFDNLDVMPPLIQAIGLIGIPWYYVLGNHDINFDARHDGHSDEFWERQLGPAYYSFNHGPTHFVVLDNVVWTHGDNTPDKLGFYRAGLGKTQLEWLERDLEHVPENQLVVLMMHIPMNENQDRDALFRLLEKRPYCLSVAAHTHKHEHRFLTAADGWKGAKPHHHVINVTTCGSWWQGAPDPFGIPHTTMRDGGPNGYTIFRFDGNQYSIAYRAARSLESEQMAIYAPEALRADETGSTTIFANVYNGSEFSTVEMSFAGGPWQRMRRTLEADPEYAKMHRRDAALALPYRPLPSPEPSSHLWKLPLPALTVPGVHPIHIRTTDMWGQKSTATRAIRVL